MMGYRFNPSPSLDVLFIYFFIKSIEDYHFYMTFLSCKNLNKILTILKKITKAD